MSEEKSVSKFIKSNGSDSVVIDPETGLPAEGIQMYKDHQTILRFHDGLLDGDVYANDGTVKKVKPAVESADGSVEYWRKGRLHRDDGLPAVQSMLQGISEWWINGSLVKTERN